MDTEPLLLGDIQGQVPVSLLSQHFHQPIDPWGLDWRWALVTAGRRLLPLSGKDEMGMLHRQWKVESKGPFGGRIIRTRGKGFILPGQLGGLQSKE